MTKRLSLIVFGLLFLFSVRAQESIKYLADKPGKFFIQNNIGKCPGQDVGSLTKNMTAIAEWVHLNNPAMNPPTGFDASVNLFGNVCDQIVKNEDFGISSRIGFTFRYFYIENGVSHTATDWAAHGTEFFINNPLALIASRFDESGFDTDDPPQLKQPLEKALENLKRYYSINPVEKEIVPGVRLYAGGYILIFNPNRPDICIPVTVREVMEARLDYYNVKQEIDGINYEKNRAAWAKMGFKPEISSQLKVYDAIKAEYDNFTTEELSEWAYSSSEEGISMINAKRRGAPVVRFNPDCWDKSIPPSAIQFMSFEYRPAAASELESFLERNDGLVDYVGLFYNQLPIEKMGYLLKF